MDRKETMTECARHRATFCVLLRHHGIGAVDVVLAFGMIRLFGIDDVGGRAGGTVQTLAQGPGQYHARETLATARSRLTLPIVGKSLC